MEPRSSISGTIEIKNTIIRETEETKKEVKEEIEEEREVIIEVESEATETAEAIYNDMVSFENYRTLEDDEEEEELY